MIITTTNKIENCPVKEYIDVICSNIVLGANIISDTIASITDFFGGTSDTYQHKLSLIYAYAKEDLTKKAERLGANAILGFFLDFDELSGKGKSMFMVSATGTACKVDSTKYASLIQDVKGQIIDKDMLVDEIRKYQINKRLNERQVLSEDDRNFLLEHPAVKVLDVLLEMYEYKENKDDRAQYASQNLGGAFAIMEADRRFIEKYIKFFINDETLDKVYILCNRNRCYAKLVINASLFDAKRIATVRDLNTRILLLKAYKMSYTKDDIKPMTDLYQSFANLPDLRKTENKKGLFGKAKTVYICPNGHEYETTREFCPECGLNGQGLSVNQVNVIQSFKEQIETLSEYFESKDK